VGKAKPVTQKLARPKSRRERQRVSVWLYALTGGLTLAIAIGLFLYFSQSRQSSPAAGLPASGAPLNVASVGKSAPGFSLQNQYGQTYTLTPGDDKNHVLVFYMGNF
jgi:cytochrome oxidase Cu insertion factor (SCO1/SenC/PrrC family)